MPDLELPDMEATLAGAFDSAEGIETAAPEPEQDTAPEAPEERAEESPAEPVEAAQEPSESPQEPTEATPQPDTQTRSYDALEQVLGPRREQFAMQGLDDATAVRQLLALSDFADRDPSNFIQWFAQQRGLDLSGMAQQPEQQQASEDNFPEVDEYTDPAVKTALEEIRAIKAQLQGQQEAQQQQAMQQYQSTVEQFRTATDEQGNQLHPHFDALRGEIAAMLRAGVSSLDEAYERALWANPTIRAQQLKIMEAERLEAQKAAAAKAERAAKQTRSPNGQFASAEPRTMEETMSEAYDRLNG